MQLVYCKYFFQVDRILLLLGFVLLRVNKQRVFQIPVFMRAQVCMSHSYPDVDTRPNNPVSTFDSP